MAELPLTVNALHKVEIEYHGKFGHILGKIQYISLKGIIYTFYATCGLATQTVAHTLTGFQGIKRCVKYISRHPH